jgi:hypothetical protein
VLLEHGGERYDKPTGFLMYAISVEKRALVCMASERTNGRAPVSGVHRKYVRKTG